MMAQAETVVTVNGKKVQINPNAVNTADNCLSASSGNVKLGGTYIKTSVVATSATNTLSITGLVSSTKSADAPLVITADGTFKKRCFPSG